MEDVTLVKPLIIKVSGIRGSVAVIGTVYAEDGCSLRVVIYHITFECTVAGRWCWVVRDRTDGRGWNPICTSDTAFDTYEGALADVARAGEAT